MFDTLELKALAKITLTVFLFVIFSKVFFTVFNMLNERKFTREIHFKHSPEKVSKYKDKKTEILIIGDSWAADKRLEKYLVSALSQVGIENSIKSIGLPGAKTKAIYECLVNSGFYENISDTHPDFCVILAGVNDVCQHIGPDYYAYHMTLIVKGLVKANIEPLPLLLPQIEPRINFKKSSILKRSRLKIYSLLFEDQKDDGILQYRNALFEQLEAIKMGRDIHFLNLDKNFNEDKSNSLKEDGIHLSTIGYQKLTQSIVKHINEKK